MFIIHTPTLEDYREIVKCAISRGMTWRSGCTRVFDVYWKSYDRRQETCIIIDEYNLLSCSNRKCAAEKYKNIPILNKTEYYGTIYGLK